MVDLKEIPDRIKQEIERYEKERIMIKQKRIPTFGRMRKNGVKLRLKREHLREVRDEYGNIEYR